MCRFPKQIRWRVWLGQSDQRTQLRSTAKRFRVLQLWLVVIQLPRGSLLQGSIFPSDRLRYYCGTYYIKQNLAGELVSHVHRNRFVEIERNTYSCHLSLLSNKARSKEQQGRWSAEAIFWRRPLVGPEASSHHPLRIDKLSVFRE